MPSGAKGPPGVLTKEVAKILRERLEADPRTQRQVGTAADISQSQLSKILRGTKAIDVDQLDRLAAVLDLNVLAVITLAEAVAAARAKVMLDRIEGGRSAAESAVQRAKDKPVEGESSSKRPKQA